MAATDDPPALTLYAYWRTSATYRVRVALNLKGVRATEALVDVDAGEHLREPFLSINPQGALPAMVEDGHPPLTQSLAILEYLDERFPDPPLLPPPSDPRGRARVRSLALLMAADTHPLITPRVRKYLTGTAGLDMDAWRAWQVNWFTAGFRAMEARLSRDAETGAFCHGDAVTMADVCLASVTAVARVFRIEVDGIPTVRRIVERCEAMDAFARADPFRQVGAPAQAA